MKQLLQVVFACACLVTPLSATVIVPANVAELAHDANLIARGTVVEVEGRWADGRRGIETIVTIEAETVLKGEPTRTTQFRVPGGTLGRYRNIVMGAPQFAVGQRVIVFLGASGPQIPYLLGMSQGVYRVSASEDGRTMVTPSALMPGAVGPIVRGAADRQPTPLAEFERNVRALAVERR